MMSMNWRNLLIWLPYSLFFLSYLLGSLPFSLWITKLKGINLREVGSGNLGTTNVYRAAGLPIALSVFLLDIVKGFFPTYLSLIYLDSPWYHILIGAVSIFAHSFTPFASFKGGKGAATGLGVLLAIDPIVFLIVFSIALVILFLFRMMSVVTITCCFITPFLLYLFNAPLAYIISVSLVSLFIILRHTANIKRLFLGTENKL